MAVVNGQADIETTEELSEPTNAVELVEDDDEKKMTLEDNLVLGGMAVLALGGIGAVIGLEVGSMVDMAVLGMAATALGQAIGPAEETTAQVADSIEATEPPKMEPSWTAYAVEPDSQAKTNGISPSKTDVYFVETKASNEKNKESLSEVN